MIFPLNISMKPFFIFNNLKVNPFYLHDKPLPGFEVLVWESHAWTYGTLWDVGGDSRFSPIGSTRVEGQIWIANSTESLDFLYQCFGKYQGNSELIQISVNIEDKEKAIQETINAETFRLTSIQKSYTIVKDGKWTIKRD